MEYEEKIKLAEKVAPLNQCSTSDVLNIIEEMLANLREIKDMGFDVEGTVDEDDLQKAIWIKTVKGEL
ncbi:hypothetical protein [Peptostreptococcus porci]|uniref:hypothetical protein n=1 Tax=Peptostreptococcus porci TaxID=2652282 RepID=UPI002A83E131|nr:hypothetical protein [Peptostreptococcus porci]MDY4127759.1 hypothetical protein [Peptostreptococcus porci]